MSEEYSRRRLLYGLTAAGVTALSGCNEGSSTPASESTGGPTDESTETTSTTTSPTETATTTTAPPRLAVESASLGTDSVGQFQPATLTMTMTNTGGERARGYASVTLDGDPAVGDRVFVPPGETRERTFEFTTGVVGQYDVTLSVEQQPTERQVAESSWNLSVTPYPDHFVGVDGTEFTCGDGSLYLNGAHDEQIGASQIPETRIREVVSLLDDLGMNVLRVFGFAPGWSEEAAQPAPGEYNESFFERFDRIIAAAKRHDVRLVVPLVGNAPGPDSVPTYVDWVDEASEHNDFYEVERCRELYKRYVHHVLTRTNPLTGLEYREDPTIMLWELGNELNCKWPKKYPLDWIREMGAYVKDLDSNHLLSTGIRGNQHGDDPNDKQSYQDGIDPATTMITDHEPDVIDAVSVHYYPRGYDVEQDEWLLRDMIRSAHEMVGKPIYLGEFNWGVSLSDGESVSARNEHLSAWFDVAAEEGLNGAMVHEVSTPAVSSGRKEHTIIPAIDDGTGDVLRSYSRWVRERSTSSCPGGTER